MTDDQSRDRISQKVHDAAASWLARRERSRDAATDEAFERWLAEDPNHRLAYDEAERNWRDGLLLADSQLGRERQLNKAPFLLRRQTHVAAAGLCVLAVLGVVAIGVVPSLGPLSVVSEARAATFQTGIGEIRTIALADGSRVTLDTQTQVNLPAKSNPRRVRLVKGRARFEVAGRGKEAFVVTAAGNEIVALGTAFDVSLTANGAKVVALQGTVDVRASPADGTKRTERLTTGQQAEIAPDRGISPPAPASPAEARWVSGMLALNSTPLSQAVVAINRYNRVQVRLADQGLGSRQVSGAFRATDPDGFATAVAAMLHLRILKSADAILLISHSDVASTPARK